MSTAKSQQPKAFTMHHGTKMSPSRLKRETCPSAGVASRGPYLSPPRLSPNCLLGTKAASEETSPPRARWSAFRTPWPLQPLPSLTGLRVLQAGQATQLIHDPRCSHRACTHMILYNLSCFSNVDCYFSWDVYWRKPWKSHAISLQLITTIGLLFLIMHTTLCCSF